MEISGPGSGPGLLESIAALAQVRARPTPVADRSGETKRADRVESIDRTPELRSGDDTGLEAADQGDARPGLIRGAVEPDRVELSPEARDASNNPSELNEAEEQQVAALQERDAEVRAHEQAHKAAGGSYAGGVSYEYTTGPDGRRYATGGSVPIDANPVPGDPEATITKMQQVRAAALAPANPSDQDRRVAAKAQQHMVEARNEALQEQTKDGEKAGKADETKRDRNDDSANREAPTGAVSVDPVTGLYGQPQPAFASTISFAA